MNNLFFFLSFKINAFCVSFKKSFSLFRGHGDHVIFQKLYCFIFHIPSMDYEHYVKLLSKKFELIYMPTKMGMSIPTSSRLPKFAQTGYYCLFIIVFFLYMASEVQLFIVIEIYELAKTYKNGQKYYTYIHICIWLYTCTYVCIYINNTPEYL